MVPIVRPAPCRCYTLNLKTSTAVLVLCGRLRLGSLQRQCTELCTLLFYSVCERYQQKCFPDTFPDTALLPEDTCATSEFFCHPTPNGGTPAPCFLRASCDPPTQKGRSFLWERRAHGDAATQRAVARPPLCSPPRARSHRWWRGERTWRGCANQAAGLCQRASCYHQVQHTLQRQVLLLLTSLLALRMRHYSSFEKKREQRKYCGCSSSGKTK